MKSFWKIFRYILLIILAISTLNALYLNEISRAVDGVILILFFISMILKDKSSNPNKLTSIVFYATGIIIIVSTMLEVFFGLSI